jgi:hypothetical protein
LYVRDVAPVMLAHPLPPLEQRCHWYVNDVGLFDQPPFPAVSVSPTWNLPSIVGGDVVAGAAANAGTAKTAADTVAAARARLITPTSLLIWSHYEVPDLQTVDAAPGVRFTQP